VKRKGTGARLMDTTTDRVILGKLLNFFVPASFKMGVIIILTTYRSLEVDEVRCCMKWIQG